MSNMANPREAEELKLRTLFFMGPAANTDLEAQLRDRCQEKLELVLHKNTEDADAKDDPTLRLSNWFRGFRKSYEIICDHRLWKPRYQSNPGNPYSIAKLFAPDSTGFDIVFGDNSNVMCETSKKRCGSRARFLHVTSPSTRLAATGGHHAQISNARVPKRRSPLAGSLRRRTPLERFFKGDPQILVEGARALWR
jgi:hypothetical protein